MGSVGIMFMDGTWVVKKWTTDSRLTHFLILALKKLIPIVIQKLEFWV